MKTQTPFSPNTLLGPAGGDRPDVRRTRVGRARRGPLTAGRRPPTVAPSRGPRRRRARRPPSARRRAGGPWAPAGRRGERFALGQACRPPVDQAGSIGRPRRLGASSERAREREQPEVAFIFVCFYARPRRLFPDTPGHESESALTGGRGAPPLQRGAMRAPSRARAAQKRVDAPLFPGLLARALSAAQRTTGGACEWPHACTYALGPTWPAVCCVRQTVR
jgi:hypothetical protein